MTAGWPPGESQASGMQMKRMRVCGACRSYTLSETHCGAATASAHPARFNPSDPYGELRRRRNEARAGRQ